VLQPTLSRSERRDLAQRGPRASRHEVDACAELLGVQHPLVRSAVAVGVLTRQLATATALVMVALAADMSGVGIGRALVLGAGVTAAVFAAGLQVARTCRRARAGDVIRAGHDGLPLRSVSRECARLQRSQGILAKSIESALAEGLRASGQRPARCRRIFDPVVIRASAGDLRELAQMVRTLPTSASALALTERLLTAGDSPLHGSDADALRREIGRIRFLLAEQERVGETVNGAGADG